jgi:hypothetical protein
MDKFHKQATGYSQYAFNGWSAVRHCLYLVKSGDSLLKSVAPKAHNDKSKDLRRFPSISYHIQRNRVILQKGYICFL